MSPKLFDAVTKPRIRKGLQLWLAQQYFIHRRHVQWYFTQSKFASTQSQVLLPEIIFTHSSPLFRQLSKEDIELQQGKVHNLKIASEQLNGLIVEAGQTFSYWKQIGRPTKS